MYNSKLFRIFQTFDKNDWKLFRRYLLTEVGEQSEILNLYDYIAKYKTDLTHKNLEIDRANKKIFEAKTKQNFQNLMSRIYGYSMEYISIQHLKSDPKLFQLQKVKALKSRHIQDMASKEAESLDGLIQQGQEDIWDALYLTQAYHYLKFSNHPESKKVKELHLLKINDNWNKAKKVLDLYYLMDMQNDEIVYHFGNQERMSQLLNSIKNYEPSSFLSEVIYHVYTLRSSRSEASFEYLFHTLKSTPHKLSFNIGAVAIIFCIEHERRKLNSTYAKIDKLYELYKIGISSKFILEKGKINDLRFLLMAELVAIVDGYEKCQKWIRENVHLIIHTYKNEIIQFSLARNELLSMNGETALDILNDIDFTHPKLQFKYKAQRLIAYVLSYPENSEFVLSQITNLEKQVKRGEGKMSNYVQTAYLNFLMILKLINSGQHLDKTIEQFKSLDIITNVVWLSKYFEFKKGQ